MHRVDPSDGQKEPEAYSSREREEKQPVQGQQGQISIKGTKNGLLLTLEPEISFAEMLDALSERLAEAPGFFRGASMAIDASRRKLRPSEKQELERLLAQYNVTIVPGEQILAARTNPGGVSRGQGSQPGIGLQRVHATAAGTTNILHGMQLQKEIRESSDTLFLKRTVRSGQAIHHPSNVVVMGDVNNGAEIVAGGDIIVWGVLRGMVHAGYSDNENATVCALLLAPVQLRIAHLLSRSPEGADPQPRPEVASIRQGQIIVETWTNGRPPRR